LDSFFRGGEEKRLLKDSWVFHSMLKLLDPLNRPIVSFDLLDWNVTDSKLYRFLCIVTIVLIIVAEVSLDKLFINFAARFEHKRHPAIFLSPVNSFLRLLKVVLLITRLVSWLN